VTKGWKCARRLQILSGCFAALADSEKRSFKQVKWLNALEEEVVALRFSEGRARAHAALPSSIAAALVGA
jgi:hypothetical protein